MGFTISLRKDLADSTIFGAGFFVILPFIFKAFELYGPFPDLAYVNSV